MGQRIHIQEAMRLTGKSRRTLYRDMDAGYVSYQRDARNRRYFDLAELIRAYGELKGEDGEPIQAAPEPPPSAPRDDVTSALVGAIEALTQQVKVLTDQNQYILDRVNGLSEDVSRIKQLPAPTYPGSARVVGQRVAEEGEKADDPNGLHALVRAMREKEEREQNGDVH